MKLIKRIKDRNVLIAFCLLNYFVYMVTDPVYSTLIYNDTLIVSYGEYKKYLIIAEIICILGYAFILFLIYRTMKGKFRIILSLATILAVCCFSVIIINGFDASISRNLNNGDIHLIYIILAGGWLCIGTVALDKKEKSEKIK